MNIKWLVDSLKENASAEKCFAIWVMMTGIYDSVNLIFIASIMGSNYHVKFIHIGHWHCCYNKTGIKIACLKILLINWALRLCTKFHIVDNKFLTVMY